MRQVAYPILIAVGVALGLWHLWVAFGAVFVFREGEPFLSWLYILFGPGATLIGVAIAAWRPTSGGYLLIALAALSTLALAMSANNAAEFMVAALSRFAIPMALLGVCFVLVGRRLPQQVPAVSNANNGA